jgi:uncharacterized protein (TIGR02145 family)
MIFLMALFGAHRVAAQVTTPDEVCVGSTKQYWVDPRPGSTYVWKIDGITQSSTTHEIFITWNAPFGSVGSPHTITVQELSVNGCFGQVKTGLVHVNELVPVSVTIAAGQNPACSGIPVTFTATATNGGATPAYNWMVNGNSTGATAGSYTYQPSAGDVVTCELNSNALCATNNPATSLPVTMQIAASPNVTFTPCYDLITSVEAQPFKLRGGLPLGGIYSGSGVNSATNMFNPAVAGAGNIPVTYTYTNVSDCPASATSDVLVLPAPSFTCGDSWTDVRDNRSYSTVQIASQCWFAENLDYGGRIESNISQADNCVNEKYCYNNDPANCATFGGLYQWDELMKYDDTPAGQGICPPGWHVPTEPEWQTLLAFYNGSAFAGRPLQDLTIPGFHALPGGVLYLNSTFSHKNLATLFWTSTPTTPVKVMSHGMNNVDQSVSDYQSLKGNAFPIRCVKN